MLITKKGNIIKVLLNIALCLVIAATTAASTNRATTYMVLTNWKYIISKHDENVLSKNPAKKIKYPTNNSPIIHFSTLPPKYSEISIKSNVGNLFKK